MPHRSTMTRGRAIGRGCRLLPMMMLIAGGCSSSPVGPASAPGQRSGANLAALLANPSPPEESRQAADQRLIARAGKRDPARLAALEEILYAAGQSDAMRIYALDRLADADAARAGQALAMHLPRFEGPVLAHACRLAIQLGDLRVNEALIWSLDRAAETDSDGATIHERPEWAALEQLSCCPVAETLLDVVEKSVEESLRIAALDILQSALPPGDAVVRVAALPRRPEDLWLQDVQAWASEFGNLPRGANETLWIRELLRPDHSSLLTAAVARHKMLAGQSDYHFAARFAAVLAATDDAALKMPRPQLLADLRATLATRQHVRREPSYKGAADDIDESLGLANEQKLSRCDLLAIRILLAGLADGTLVAELHRQGLIDLSDTTSEHGGLLTFEARRLIAREYPAMLARSDYEYVTGDRLLRETATGIAQYHFHFQEVHNARRAGPGPGDLQYVRRARCNGVVITSLEARKVDVDFYTPAGTVIDLGVFGTP